MSRLPANAEVEGLLVRLLSGDLTREEVADWAAERMEEQEEASMADHDPVVWDALTSLRGADLLIDTGVYLHHEVDFQAWLDDFRQARRS